MAITTCMVAAGGDRGSCNGAGHFVAGALLAANYCTAAQ